MKGATGCTRLIEGLIEPPPPEAPADSYRMVMICEGEETVTEEEHRAAWQYLHDSGMAYTLQGRFGRQARRFIEDGYINE